MKSQKRQTPIPSREITEEGEEIKTISGTSVGRGKKITSAHHTENYVSREHIFRFHKFVGESVHAGRGDLVNFKARHRKQNQRSPDHPLRQSPPPSRAGPNKPLRPPALPRRSASRTPQPRTQRGPSSAPRPTPGASTAQRAPGLSGRAGPRLSRQLRGPHRQCGRYDEISARRYLSRQPLLFVVLPAQHPPQLLHGGAGTARRPYRKWRAPPPNRAAGGRMRAVWWGVARRGEGLLVRSWLLQLLRNLLISMCSLKVNCICSVVRYSVNKPFRFPKKGRQAACGAAVGEEDVIRTVQAAAVWGRRDKKRAELLMGPCGAHSSPPWLSRAPGQVHVKS